METQKLVYFKKADKLRNRIIIPQHFINQNGNEFYMEVHNDKIILIPAKKGE